MSPETQKILVALWTKITSRSHRLADLSYGHREGSVQGIGSAAAAVALNEVAKAIEEIIADPPNPMKNEATLKTSCPFFKFFEGGRVPIKNIVLPNQAQCIGDGVQDVYMVDLDKLTPAQFDHVARAVVAQNDPSYPLDRAKAEMREHGLPLRAKHVQSVSTDSMYFL